MSELMCGILIGFFAGLCFGAHLMARDMRSEERNTRAALREKEPGE